MRLLSFPALSHAALNLNKARAGDLFLQRLPNRPLLCRVFVRIMYRECVCERTVVLFALAHIQATSTATWIHACKHAYTKVLRTHSDVVASPLFRLMSAAQIFYSIMCKAAICLVHVFKHMYKYFSSKVKPPNPFTHFHMRVQLFQIASARLPQPSLSISRSIYCFLKATDTSKLSLSFCKLE